MTKLEHISMPTDIVERLRRSLSTILATNKLSPRSNSEAGFIIRRLEAVRTGCFAGYEEAVRRALRNPRHSAHSLEGGQAIDAVLIKPMGDACNLACDYCYEGRTDERFVTGRMSSELLEKLLTNVFEQATDRVALLWHGGEPTLAGLDFFIQAIELQRRLNTRGVTVSNAIQTHALTIDDRWVGFFRDNGFTVGVSVDGTREIHDKHRRDRHNKPTFDRVAANIERMTAAGISVGIISVIHPECVGNEVAILEQFQQLGVKHADFHPQFGGFPFLNSPLPPPSYSKFMIRIFDEWTSNKSALSILTFEEFFRFLLGETPHVCYFSGRCNRIVAVEGDGSVVSCTRPFDRTRYTFGNIAREDFSGILSSEPFQRFKREDETARDATAECLWQGMCGNGCPQHRLSSGQPNVAGANLYCRCVSGNDGGYAAIWDHIILRVKEAVENLNQESSQK